jgi:hypothetical protein
MTEAQTYAWIFYAVSVTASNVGATHREIEAAADGINHAFPTQREFSVSLAWIESKGLISRAGVRVKLSDEGEKLAASYRKKRGSVPRIWDQFTRAFQKLGADNLTQLDCRTMKATPGRDSDV